MGRNLQSMQVQQWIRLSGLTGEYKDLNGAVLRHAGFQGPHESDQCAGRPIYHGSDKNEEDVWVFSCEGQNGLCWTCCHAKQKFGDIRMRVEDLRGVGWYGWAVQEGEQPWQVSADGWFE